MNFFSEKFKILFLSSIFLFLSTSINQENKNNLISITYVKTIPIPPFPEITIKIQKNEISQKVSIPAKLEFYNRDSSIINEIDTTIQIRKLQDSDFDSLEKFIITSGILNIRFSENSPNVTLVGLGDSFYTLKTTKKIIRRIPRYPSFVPNDPDILKEFNKIMQSLLEKYEFGRLDSF